jgi:hypothetical protein
MKDDWKSSFHVFFRTVDPKKELDSRAAKSAELTSDWLQVSTKVESVCVISDDTFQGLVTHPVRIQVSNYSQSARVPTRDTRMHRVSYNC